MLNKVMDCFSSADYVAGSGFHLSKSISHNNLVEVNINALRETYRLNEKQFKETIGNFNWKKFSDRIQEQISNNPLLTLEQRQIMQVNGIVALIRSHQFELARKQWRDIRGSNNHPTLNKVSAYFHL